MRDYDGRLFGGLAFFLAPVGIVAIVVAAIVGAFFPA